MINVYKASFRGKRQPRFLASFIDAEAFIQCKDELEDYCSNQECYLLEKHSETIDQQLETSVGGLANEQ